MSKNIVQNFLVQEFLLSLRTIENVLGIAFNDCSHGQGMGEGSCEIA